VEDGPQRPERAARYLIVDTSTTATGAQRPATARRLDRVEVLFAAFAALCAMALSFVPRLVEPDDHAYQASIVGITHGHWLTLSTAHQSAGSASNVCPRRGRGR
jgi:hypothetical protein